MSFIHRIADTLIQVGIIDETFKRKQVVDKVLDHSIQISRHVAKIALYPEHSARKHWEKEIHSFVRSVQELKFNGHKRLVRDEYKKNYCTMHHFIKMTC